MNVISWKEWEGGEMELIETLMTTNHFEGRNDAESVTVLVE